MVMNTLPDTSYKKATQALNFFAEKKEGRINKMKAIKLIYLADRLHLRRYGRPIVGDVYWAMKLGPVGSCAKKIAELSPASKNNLAYAKLFIKPADDKKQSFFSIRPTEMGVFSKTDIECLEAVYNQFSDKDQFELAELTHRYPEWVKHARELKSGKKRVPMRYEDFFAPAESTDTLFAEDKATLELAKETFEESAGVSSFFGE